MDFLDRLYQQYKELFDFLDDQFHYEENELWDDGLVEPTEQELVLMDLAAEQLRQDILGDDE